MWKESKFFYICIIINREIHTFMFFGVLGEYSKSLFASSPCTHRFFPRILRIRLYTSAYLSTIFCTANNPSLPYSPYTLKYFPSILWIRLNTFRVLSEYAGRLKNTQRELFTFDNDRRLQREKIEWGVIYLPRMNSLQNLVFGYL